MVTNKAAKYETRILQKNGLQNTQTNLNWSWLYLQRYTDEQKILLTYLHLHYGSFVGTTVENICNNLKLKQGLISQVEAVVTKALIKADKFYFISNFRMPTDCFIRSFNHFYNLELPIPARVGSLYVQSLIPPYVDDLWIPECFVDTYYQNFLAEAKILIKDLSGFRIII